MTFQHQKLAIKITAIIHPVNNRITTLDNLNSKMTLVKEIGIFFLPCNLKGEFKTPVLYYGAKMKITNCQLNIELKLFLSFILKTFKYIFLVQKG